MPLRILIAETIKMVMEVWLIRDEVTVISEGGETAIRLHEGEVQGNKVISNQDSTGNSSKWLLYCNIARKFVQSNSIAQACTITWCTHKMKCANVFVLKNRTALNGFKVCLSPFLGWYVIKELVHAFSCVSIELWNDALGKFGEHSRS